MAMSDTSFVPITCSNLVYLLLISVVHEIVARNVCLGFAKALIYREHLNLHLDFVFFLPYCG